MPRLIATTADEMLAPSGTAASVMGQYDDLDADLPGKVVLASANMMPNPDLVDLNERGRLEGWDLDAPPSPDGWNVYIKQLTRIDAAGNHVRIGGSDSDNRPMLRQNETMLRWARHTYQQDSPLLTDKALPDLGKDGDTDLAPIQNAPRVGVANKAGGVGYPAQSAGALVCSYFGILGPHPHKSMRITNAAPAIPMPAIAQGQVIVFFLPDELPDSWTGVGFCVGPDANNMRIQARVDVRGRVLTQIIDRGPYRRDGAIVTELGTNRTFIADFEQLAAPRVWHDRSHFILKSEHYQFAYQLKTKQGWSAASLINFENVANDQNGECIRWIPPTAALQKPGVERWRPLFKARDDNWYTFVEAFANGYPLHKAATVHGTQVSHDKWKHSAKPKKVSEGRPEIDHSGTPGPADVMETPVAQGAESMKPGRYAVRVTTANGEEDMESRPSPRSLVVLRDAGLNGGGAASFATDQMIRVFRPPGQTIKNSRLVEVDKNDGSTELHWERPASTPEVTVNDGVLSVVSSTGTGTKVYRRSSIEPVNDQKYYSVRYRMDVNSITASTINLRLRFISAAADDVANPNFPNLAPTVLGTATLEDFTAVDDRHVKQTFGPAGGSAHFDMPAGTKYVQIEVTGTSASARAFNFAVSNVGLWWGRAFPRKIYDLVLADDTPAKDSWPVPDSEGSFHTIHYPPGPYCRVVTNPVSPALHRAYTQIENKNFEDGTTTANGWTASTPAGGAALGVQTLYAISGFFGMRADVTAASGAYSAFISKGFSSHSPSTTFGLEAQVRIKTRPSTGTVGLVGVTKTATLTDYMAYLQIDSAGALTMRYLNASSVMTTSSTLMNVQNGDDLRVDFAFTNLGTAGTTVTMRVKRNDRDPVTTGALTTLASSQVNQVLAGFFAGTTGATTRVLIDRVRMMTSAITESTAVPGNMVEYWAPEGNPAGNPDHLMTGIRYPVKPGVNYVDSVYMAHDGITTPAVGADMFMVTSYDADGNELFNHGYVITGISGKSHWDRYQMAYTAPAKGAVDPDGGTYDADAAYVEYTRNHVGDGLIWVMGFQHETGSFASTFINTNATSGTFSVVFKSTPQGGPKDGDVSFNSAVLRTRIAATQMYDVNGNPLTTTSWRMRAADTQARLATATYGAANALNAGPGHEYIEVEVTLTSTLNTLSPEVRAVFVDVQRDRPVVTQGDGRDFHGGIIAYDITPSSPRPTVVRQEMADGSVQLQNVGRFKPPEVLKLSMQAFTELGKRIAERNVSTSTPLFAVEYSGTRYLVMMMPEFTGSTESSPDGTAYFDYVADGLEADVLGSEDM